MTTTLDDAGLASLTIGVEEEFLLVDPDTGVNRPVADKVVDALPDGIRERGALHFRRSVLEMATGVRTDLDELHTELTELRRAAAAAAEKTGAWLVAVGATPIGELEPSVAAQPRYQAMVDRYGPIALDPAVCGMHVHVGVPDRELAVQVCNHLQVWLPAIRALTGNSPLFEGADTGHASWRSIQLLRWPTLGPTPWFGCATDYDETVAALITGGVLLDPSMVYWYARLSPTLPSIEIRVNDVCTDVGDTVLTAALIRAAVATAVTDVRAGRPAPRLRDCVTAAAHWRAARDGLTRTLIDLRLNRARPAWDLINEFFATVSPALLYAGDLDRVIDGLTRLRKRGDGASRQRETYRHTGDLNAVLADLAARTVTG